MPPLRPSTDDLNATLGRVLANRHDASPRDAARDVALRAYTVWPDIADDRIRHWLLAADRSRFADIASESETFWPIAKACRERVARASSPAARRAWAFHIANRLVGYLLTPPTAPPLAATGGLLTPPRMRMARRAMTIIALQAIDDVLANGMRQAFSNAPALAVTMGISERRAMMARGDAIGLGWLRVMPHQPEGVPLRIDLGATNSAWAGLGSQAMATRRLATVEAIRERKPESDPLATLIVAARDRGLSYGVGVKTRDAAWLYAVCTQAGIEPLDMDADKARFAAAAWAKILPPDQPVSALPATLEALAAAEVAQEKHGRKETARAEHAAVRAAESALRREQRSKVESWLKPELKERPVPTVDVDPAEVEEWARDLYAQLNDFGVPDDLRDTVALALRERLRRRGWSKDAAKDLANRIAGVVTERSAS